MAQLDHALSDCPNLYALLRATARRLRWCSAWKLFRIGSWCSAVFLALAGGVHLGLRPLPHSATLVISLLPVLIPPVLSMCFSDPGYRQAARRLDEAFDGKNLFVTSLDLALRDSGAGRRMTSYVLDQAELSAASWKHQSERLPRLEAWSNAWIPLGLWLSGFFVLFSGGEDRAFPDLGDEKARIEQAGESTPDKPAPFPENRDARPDVSQFVTTSNLNQAETGGNPRQAQSPKSGPGTDASTSAANSKNPRPENGGQQSIWSMPSPDRSDEQVLKSGQASSGRDKQKTAAAGEGSNFSRTYGRSTEHAELTLRWTDLERGEGEQASDRRRELKPGSIARPEARGLAPSPETSGPAESQGLVPLSPAMRRYSDRYFQFLTKHTD